MTRLGRPRIAPAGRASAHPVYLTPDTLATAKRLGDGNVSAGVRSALGIVCDAHAALAMAEYDGTVTDAHRDAVREAESLHRNSR